MGVKRILISRLDRLCNLTRARRRFLFASNKSSFMRRRFKPLPMDIGVESLFWGIVPFYGKSSATFNCGPRVIRNDGDPARQFDDRSNSMNGARFVFVHSLYFGAGKRRSFERCIQHSRNFDVDTVLRLATNDVRPIDACSPLANDFEIARILQWRILWYLQFRGVAP